MTKYIPETAQLNDVVMTGEELMDSTNAVVRTFSDQFDTPVHYAGDGAATDGNHVYLPSVPQNAEITLRQSLVMGGFANHETLHKLMTDFDKIQPRFRKWHEEGKKFTKAMNNAIEDVRIENGGRVLYNGIAKAIDKTAREVNRKFIDEVYPQAPEVVNDWRRVGPVAVTWAGRKALGYPDPSNQEALDLLPPDIRKRAERVAKLAMGLDTGVRGMANLDQRAAHNGSWKAVLLAERLTRELEKEEREREEEENSDDPRPINPDDEPGDNEDINEANIGDEDGDRTEEQDDGTGDSGQEGEEGSDEGEEEREGVSSGEDTQEEGDDGLDDDDTTGGISAGADEEREEEPDPVDHELNQAARAVADEINSDPSQYRVFNPTGDKVYENFGRDEDRSVYESMKREAGGALATIRRKLERVLLAAKRSYWENGKPSGKLDVRRNATKIVQYNSNVFRRRQTEQAVNSALSILVDQSGSMWWDKTRLAADTTIAVCEALESSQTPIEVIGHYTFNCVDTKDVQSDQLNEAYRKWNEQPESFEGSRKARIKALRAFMAKEFPYGRLENIAYHIHKNFDTPLSMCRKELGALRRINDGANADADAILFTAKRLLARDEERKVLLVLSDGAPAWNSMTHDTDQMTRDAVQWCIEQGITVIGIGILDHSVSNYYPSYVVVTNLEDFAKTYINVVADAVLGRSTQASNLMNTGVTRATKM